MNSFERILATIKGESTDRHAFTATLSQYGSNYCGASNQEYYQNAQIYCTGQKAIYEKFEPDLIFAPFALSLIGKAFGAELKYYSDRPPMLKKPKLQSVEELLNIEYPDINSNPDLMYLRNCIKNLTNHFENKVPVAAISLNPVDIPIVIFGIEKWLDIFLFERELFNKTMEYIVPFFVSLTNSFFADGAACVVMPTVFANSNSVTRQQTIEIVNQILKSAFSQVNGAVVMHHGGVPFLPYLDTYTDFPQNVIGFGMDWTDDYKKARQIIGNERVILSGVESVSLHLKTKNQIKEECLKILEMSKDDKKHILFTCSSDVLVQTPQENILALKDAINEFSNDK